jgi:hypothetical protein
MPCHQLILVAANEEVAEKTSARPVIVNFLIIVVPFTRFRVRTG